MHYIKKIIIVKLRKQKSNKTIFLEPLKKDNLKLIGLHSSLKDYQIVYNINYLLKSKFIRSKKDITLRPDFYSSHYRWKSESKGIDFELFSNKLITGDDDVQQDIKGLFSYPELKELYLIKKYKEVDFFIKQNCFYSSDKLIKTLKQVKGISFAYRIYDIEEKLNFDL